MRKRETERKEMMTKRTRKNNTKIHMEVYRSYVWKNVNMYERDKKRNIMKRRMNVVINRETERKTTRIRIRRNNQTKRRMEFQKAHVWKNVEMQEREKKENITNRRIKVVGKRETDRKTTRTIIRRKKQTKISMDFQRAYVKQKVIRTTFL